MHAFFALDSSEARPRESFAPFDVELWRPSSLKPKELPLIPFAVWTLFHALHIFKNRDYALLLMRDNGRLIHRSCIFPGWFRFPFMRRDDLQIGDTETDPHYRGKGIAPAAIEAIVARLKKPGRRFWYICDDSNAPSIRAVEKAGFKRVGTGGKNPRLGLSILGKYEMQ